MYTAEELVTIFDLKHPRMRGSNLMAACPFSAELHEDGTDDYNSFGININTSRWNCFACRQRGTNIRTLAYALKIMLPDDVMNKSLLSPPKLEDITESRKPDYSQYVKILSRGAKQAYEKLRERGISFSAIKRFHVGCNKEGSIIFPCILPDGKLYGWIERNNIWDGRYGYAPRDVQRKWLLFGLDRKIERVFLTESMTDMLKMATFGVDAVSTCGNMVFDTQAQLIIENCGELVLVSQNDKPAMNWMKDCEKQFRKKIRTYQITIPAIFKDLGGTKFRKELWEKTLRTMKFLY